MSKRLLIRQTVYPSNIGFPVKTGTWDFLQDSHIEESSSIIKNLIINICGVYDSTKIYILNGMVLGASGGSTTITSGSVFFNGEIYQCQSTSFTTVAGQVPVANLVVNNYTPTDLLGNNTADPVNFITSPSGVNVHNIRIISFSSGVSGTGQFASQTPIPTPPSFTTPTASGSSVNDYGNMINLQLSQFASTSGTLVVSTGSGNGTVTGTIYYKKYYLNNTIKIYGSLTSATPSDFTDYNYVTNSGSQYYNMGTLPAGFRPSSVAQNFVGYNGLSQTDIENYATSQYIPTINAVIDTSGNLLVRWVKPKSGTSSLLYNFSAILSLD